MTLFAPQVGVVAQRQYGAIAHWQLRRAGLDAHETREALRGLRRVFRGVCALGDLDELGWFMAAALAMGPTGAISHQSALMLLGLRPHQPGPIHVSHTGGNRRPREGLVPHQRTKMQTGLWNGVIPVTSPSQSLQDAALPPHELYRAIEQARKLNHPLTLPRNDIQNLQRRVRGYTRSDTEARFLLLCHDHRLPLPLVNHHLNGFETDFHWPRDRVVVEVDGFEHHREREPFNTDRYRGLVHEAQGWHVIRISADHVYDEPALVLAALRRATGW